MVHDISLKCTSEPLFGWKLWKLWLASESNYDKQNYEECVIVRHRIKPQAEKKQLKMERTKMIGFERRNDTKPCYWNCVDTLNSAATTFRKTASHSLLTKQKGPDSVAFVFTFKHSDFKELWFSTILFLFSQRGWQMNDDDRQCRHRSWRLVIRKPVNFDRVQVKSCTFISSNAFCFDPSKVYYCATQLFVCTLLTLINISCSKTNLFFFFSLLLLPNRCDMFCVVQSNNICTPDKKWSK